MDTLQHINLSFSNNLHTTTKDYRHMDISVLLGCCNQDKSLIYEECCQKQYTTRSDFFYKDSIIKAFFLPKMSGATKTETLINGIFEGHYATTVWHRTLQSSTTHSELPLST